MIKKWSKWADEILKGMILEAPIKRPKPDREYSEIRQCSNLSKCYNIYGVVTKISRDQC